MFGFYLFSLLVFLARDVDILEYWIKLLKSLFVLLLLAGLYAPSYAAVSDIELVSCGVFNDENSNGDDKKEGGKKRR